MLVGIINYGMGNINSVINILKYLGINYRVSNDFKEINKFSSLILPGVGSFKRAMINLKALGLSDEIKEYATIKKKNVLGICLGMQLLGKSSTEDGLTEGLGLIRNEVTKFDLKQLRIPHVGFNNITKKTNSFRLLKNCNEKDNFYFVHSYKMMAENNSEYAICEYGTKFLAAFELQNIFGVQFHPEKSQSSGIKIFQNFFQIK